MPRRLRGRQADFDPGTSGSVEGPFTNEAGDTVAVVVKVRGCDEPHGPVKVTTSRDLWRVELPPDIVYDLNGLVGADGVPVRLTIVARACTEPDDDGGDADGDGGRLDPQPWDDEHLGVESAEADVVAENDDYG